tara:strand:- start:78 stop:1295 length:1218 start_codon:yes stop_codon:yes gene_type:complete
LSTRRFRGGITNNIQTEVRERRSYFEFIQQKKLELGINFLDTVHESKLYGFIDENYNIVEPNPELVSFGEYSGNIVGQNFLVSAYNSFRDYYLQKSQDVGIEIPQYFPGLVVKKSFEDINENYERYQTLVSQVMLDPFLVGRFADMEQMNFSSFISKLNEVLFDEDKKNYKIPKTGYILSPYAKVYETGLYVDLAPELDPSIDYVKSEIVSDSSFQCFGEIANQFGFLIDQNCPWRLVLDLKSPNVQSNILNKDFSRPFSAFYSSTYLMKPGLDDYWNVKSFYKRMYIEYFRLKMPGVSLLASALDSYPEESWIECYLLNRLRDLGFLKNPDFFSSDESPTPQKTAFKNILTDCLERFNILNREMSHGSGVLTYIESVCANILKERIELFLENRRSNADSSIFVY